MQFKLYISYNKEHLHIRSVCGLVVECLVAIEATRVRFPADAAMKVVTNIMIDYESSSAAPL